MPLFSSDKVRRDQNQSSPIVWGDRVFVTVSYWPEGKQEKEFPEHHVICFKTSDGSRLWDTPIPPGPWKLSDLRGGYTVPTPATNGKVLVVGFGSAVVAGLDFDGKIVWRQEITPYAFDVCWGASPVIYRDTVLVLCDETNKNASSLRSYDLATGTLKWEKKRNADWTHTTPIIVGSADHEQLLVAAANGPDGLDPTTGDLIWSVNFGKRVGDTVSPVYRDGQLYIDSGRGGPGIAVDTTGKGDVSKTHVRWKLGNVPEGFSSPLLVGDYLYRLHSPGVIQCWKWATGAEVFRERLEGIDPAVSPIVTPDDRIYIASGGKSYVLAAGPQLKILGRGDLGDPSRASPAVAAGRMYIKGGRNLYCIGKD